MDVHIDVFFSGDTVEIDGVHMMHAPVGPAAQQFDGADLFPAAPENDQGMQLMAGVFTSGECADHQPRADPAGCCAQRVIVVRIAALGELTKLMEYIDIFLRCEHGFLRILGNADTAQNHQGI